MDWMAVGFARIVITPASDISSTVDPDGKFYRDKRDGQDFDWMTLVLLPRTYRKAGSWFDRLTMSGVGD